MDVAIIGAGNVGRALTTSLTRAGHTVTVASRNSESARALADETGAKAAPTGREAIESADVVVLAVPYSGVPDVIDEAGGALTGKIVIDATNPLKADYSGLVTEGTSGAEEIQRWAPGARVVKALNTQLASRQADPRVAGGLRVDGYVAADDVEAKEKVLALAGDIGLHPVDAGGLGMARYLEATAYLNIALQVANGWNWQAGWKLIGPEGDAA
jgi:8-hydroxy-5-deazaflavin:NADPH oxidoreductase